MKYRTLFKIGYLCNHIFNHLCSRWYRMFIGHVGKGTLIRRHCRLDGDSLDKVIIGDNCSFDTYFCLGARARLEKEGERVIPSIEIGDNCTIGQYNHITSVNKIIIGDNLLTGKFVLISDNSHGKGCFDEMKIHPSKRAVVSKGEIVIGNNVWLGDKVSVLAGVHIGNGCIIGANSVVTHDIPPYSIAAGIPAKILKTIEE